MLTIYILLLLVFFVSVFFLILYKRGQRNYRPTRQEVILILEKIKDGKIKAFEWDNFIYVPIHNDMVLEGIRKRCEAMQVALYCSNLKEGFYFNEKGIQEVKMMIKELE